MVCPLDATAADTVMVPARSPLRKSPLLKSNINFGAPSTPPPPLPKHKRTSSISPILIPQLDYAYHSFSDEDDASYSEESIFSTDPQSPMLPKCPTIIKDSAATKVSQALSPTAQVSLMEILNEEADSDSLLDLDDDILDDELDLFDVMSTCVITDVTERVSFSMGAVIAEVKVTH